jgi:hypothetical protein
MSDDQHIAVGHVRVVSNDGVCFWAVPPDLEPFSVGCFDPWAHTDPLKCETMSLSEWQDIRASQT